MFLALRPALLSYDEHPIHSVSCPAKRGQQEAPQNVTSIARKPQARSWSHAGSVFPAEAG
jgi:hypothetical protein